MRILIIHSYYFPNIKGGAEYSIKKLAEGLVKKGHEVSCLCSTEDNDVDEMINGVRIYRRKMKSLYVSKSFFSKVRRAFLELYNPKNYEIVQKCVDMVKPDIIYTNCLEHISSVAWKVAQSNQIKIADSQRVYILLQMAGGKYRVGNRLWKSINRFFSRYVNQSIFISEYTKNQFLAERFFPNASHMVIHNAIDYDYEELRRIVEEHIRDIDNEEVFRFVYLGTLAEHKGVNLLLKAYEAINNSRVELHIAGDGPLSEDVIKYCELQKGAVYHGWMDEESLMHLISKCHCLVCPSIWPEPFGRVVLDAYKQGVPVIASKEGGFKETVDHEGTGLLIETNDVEGLKNAMLVISENKDIYKVFCRNIPQKLFQFSLDNYLVKYEKAFENLWRS